MPYRLIAVSLAVSFLALLPFCSKQSNKNKSLKPIIETEYGWTKCPAWKNIVFYSDGNDIIFFDLKTNKKINLTGISEKEAKEMSKKMAFMKVEHIRQPTAELHPVCAPDSSLIAFAAYRKNDNQDRTDDSDSDIWAVVIDDKLIKDLRSGKCAEKSKEKEDDIPIYHGKLYFVQLTNYRGMDEVFPRFGHTTSELYFEADHALYKTNITAVLSRIPSSAHDHKCQKEAKEKDKE